MKCPHCNQETITFREWCAGSNALRWICPRCFASLRANGATKSSLVAIALLAAGILGGVIFADQRDLFASGSGRGYLGLAFLLVLYPVGYLLFRTTCGYVLDALPVIREDAGRGDP